MAHFYLRVHRSHLRGLVKTQILCQWVWGGPKISISNKLLGDADVAGLGTTLSSKASWGWESGLLGSLHSAM